MAFVSHIFSFTSFTPLVFLVCQSYFFISFFCKCLWTSYCNLWRVHIWQPHWFFTLMTNYGILACQTYLSLFIIPVSFEIVHIYIYIYIYIYALNTNVYEVLSWHPLIVYIWQPYLFLHIYDHLWIPCLAGLADVFLFPYLCQYILKLYTHVHMYKILISILIKLELL